MEVWKNSEVENVLLFTGGLDSILSYIKLKRSVTKLKLFYVPINRAQEPKYVNGEINTINTLIKKGINFIDHDIFVSQRNGVSWSGVPLVEPDFSEPPYKELGLIFSTLLEFPIVKTIWYSPFNIQLDSKGVPIVKLLEKYINKVGLHPKVKIDFAFELKSERYEIIRDLIKSTPDNSKKATLVEFILHAYSSNVYISNDRQRIINFVNSAIEYMSDADPIARSVYMSMLRSRNIIPSIDKRGFNTIPDLILNIDLYAGLKILLPFVDNKVLLNFKKLLLSNTKKYSKKFKRAGVEYINIIQKLQTR